MNRHAALTSRLNGLAGITKPTKKNVMKHTHNNTALICLTLGLLTGSVLAGLMIDTNWFVLSVVFGFALAIFTVTHGSEKVSHAIIPRAKNTFKK